MLRYLPKDYELVFLFQKPFSPMPQAKKRKDGTIYWTEVTITLIDFQGQKAALSINHDITERIVSEAKLMESREHFRDLIEQAGDALFVFDFTLREKLACGALVSYVCIHGYLWASWS